MQTVTETYRYRVVRTDGPLLLLQAEVSGVRGWGLAIQFVPIERSIEFFTDEIRAHPQDVFPILMRAKVWIDHKKTDRALADSDLAVLMQPKDPLVYICRSMVKIEIKVYEKAVIDLERRYPARPPSLQGL